MDKLCCIISAGDVNDTLLQKNKELYDCFIAADAGYEKALLSNIHPSVLVGDFDSLSQPPDTHIKTITYPVEKDFSDTHLAIEEGIKLGYTHFHIYGALGGERISHSISNLQTLCTMKERNISVTLMGKKEQVYLIKDETLTLTPPLNSTFSVFSLSDETKDVTITGAKYPLNKAVLSNAYPLGLSNQSASDTVTISSKDGYLLVILEI